MKSALDAREFNRETEINDMRSKVPGAVERMGIEDRLDKARSIGFDVSREYAKRSEAEHTTAADFLRELIASDPVGLLAVKARFKRKEFYKGEWKPTGEATAASNAEKEALTKIIAEEEEKFAKIDNARRELRAAVRKLAQDIKYENDQATNALNLIANEQLRTIVLNTGLEATGAAAGALATGGLSAAFQLASKSNGLFSLMKGSAHALKSNLGKVRHADMTKFVGEAVAARIGKVFNGELASVLTEADGAFDLGLNAVKGAGSISVNAKTGLQSDAGALIVGDIAEFGIGKALGRVTEIVAEKVGPPGLPSPALTKAAAMTSLGIDVATTTTKALVSARAQALNMGRANEYLAAHMAAQTFHAAFLPTKNMWLRAEKITKAQRELIETLKIRRELGPKNKKLSVVANAADATKGDRIELILKFSSTLTTAPEISAPGMMFTNAVVEGFDNSIWKTTGILQDDIEQTKLTVSLHQSERPWTKLDSNPETTPRVVSLLGNYWQGYEAGKDEHHEIRFGITPITFCGCVDLMTERDKLKPLLGPAFDSLIAEVEQRIEKVGSSDGKKIMFNENYDLSNYSGGDKPDIANAVSIFVLEHAAFSAGLGVCEGETGFKVTIAPSEVRKKWKVACRNYAHVGRHCVPNQQLTKQYTSACDRF